MVKGIYFPHLNNIVQDTNKKFPLIIYYVYFRFILICVWYIGMKVGPVAQSV
jgi:hypothetical protein